MGVASPSMRADRPLPGVDRKSAIGNGAMPSAFAAAAIAVARGCPDPCSRLAATRSTSARVAPPYAITSVDRGTAFGQRAGLVDDQRLQPPRLLQRRRVADDDAGLRAAPGADHDRGRRGEAQRARAGDDQHGHGAHQGLRPAAQPPPREREGDERDHDDHRDEHARDAIGQALDRRLGALRLGDQAHDPASSVRVPTPVASQVSMPSWFTVPA